MNKLYFWSVTSALAGFLFGFDTVVISGAEKRIQELWQLSDSLHGFAVASALYGTVIGSLIGGWPTEKFGRKQTLFWVGALYLLSALGTAFANDVYTFSIARFLGGLGIGVSTIAAPLYISEISPPDKRGRLAGMFQFNIVFGILIAFVSNTLLSDIGENAWRWMLGVQAIPSIIYMVMCLTIPESPRWLISRKGKVDEGKRILSLISPNSSHEEIESTAREIAMHSGQKAVRAGFWSSCAKRPIMLAIMIAVFNQVSGINAILYFAPRIFELAGMEQKSALLQSIGIGVTNLIFTFIGLWLIDKLGRKTLMYIGSFGYIISLSLVAWAFYTENYAFVPYYIFAFIAAHAVGQGAVIWVFISEIFPNEHRASGQALGSFTHWIFAAVITTYFTSWVSKFHPGSVFVFFAFMMFLQLLWVKFMMPETKGVALEDMEKRLMH